MFCSGVPTAWARPLPAWPPDAQTPILNRRQWGQNTVPDLIDRFKAALADRYAIEHERAE